jgi:hypothetical protein
VLNKELYEAPKYMIRYTENWTQNLQIKKLMALLAHYINMNHK